MKRATAQLIDILQRLCGCWTGQRDSRAKTTAGKRDGGSEPGMAGVWRLRWLQQDKELS